MIRTTSRFLVATLMAFGLLPAGAAQANHIDFIEDGSFVLTANPPAGSSVSGTQTGAGGNILGTEREVTLTLDQTTGGSSTALTQSLSNTVNGGTGFINIADDPGSSSTLSLLYDGVGSGGFGPSDFDTLWNSIVAEVSLLETTALLTLTVTDTGSNIGAATRSAVEGLVFFQFSDPGYSAVDFTQVDSVQLDITSTSTGGTLYLAGITREANVPEPTTALLLGGGLALLAARRRTRTL